MLKPNEPSFLLRVDAQLPVGLKLNKRKFREGWNSVPPCDIRVLAKRVASFEWQLVADAKALLRGGLGDTPQSAISDALKLALQQMNDSFNAARVEYLRVEQYPWFYVATVVVYPYAIRQGGVLPLPVQAAAAQSDGSTAPLGIPCSF